MKSREVHAIKEIEKRLNESKIKTQDGMVNEGIALDASMVSEESTDDNTSTEQQYGSSSLGYNVDVKRAWVDKAVFNKENGPGFENQNDVENPYVLNKAKELAPSLHGIDKMGQDESVNHKIISKEELESEIEKRLKEKQRKYMLLYHGFVYGLTQFEEPSKVPLKRIDVNLKRNLEQAQLANYHPKL
uniref:Uncharacterized protein n=1 Tax=Tanacetum cinerariifolium TaxID=118510 RepID=A0A699IIY0_TANCI|nr:hypothetical protein [Tanacetum cinerariifolium]